MSKLKVPITDLFTDDFIRAHTQYNSLQAMVKACGAGAPLNILSPTFQIFCTYMTDFHSWDAMFKAAKAEYIQRKRMG